MRERTKIFLCIRANIPTYLHQTAKHIEYLRVNIRKRYFHPYQNVIEQYYGRRFDIVLIEKKRKNITVFLIEMQKPLEPSQYNDTSVRVYVRLIFLRIGD